MFVNSTGWNGLEIGCPYLAIRWNAPFYAKCGFVQLDETEIPPNLLDILSRESARGFNPGNRIAMRFDLSSSKKLERSSGG